MKIELNAEEQKYVCRAGLKLEKALAHFKVNLQGKVRNMAWTARPAWSAVASISVCLQPVMH